ncbi:MAG: helix-turn-helix domain-containing protein [Ignavibacteriaceae bacterium]|nr:helix-turn-helix domain-containing protein [Ignavibacteriaceae bacterium]
MSQIVNFDTYEPRRLSKKGVRPVSEDATDITGSLSPNNFTPEDFYVQLLLKENPKKFMYTQEECAEYLNLSYQYINRRCREGKIQVTKFGEKKLISINELARLIIEGVKA